MPYLKKFSINVEKSMDVAALFNSRERITTFLAQMMFEGAARAKELYEQGEGIPPIVYHKKSLSIVADYSFVVYQLARWMANYGGCSLDDSIKYVKKYFTIGSRDFDFHNKFFINVILNDVYNLINMRNDTNAFKRAYATPAIYLGFDGEKYQIFGVPFKASKVISFLSDGVKKTLEENVLKQDFQQIAFGKREVDLAWGNGEKRYAYGL